MCWSCSSQRKSLLSDFFREEFGGIAHFRAASAASAQWLSTFDSSFLFDGDKFAVAGRVVEPGSTLDASQSLFATTTDTVADDFSTSATLTVDGPHVIGTLDSLGDQDFYKVELVAGQSYEIGHYAYAGGPSGIPNIDAYVEIYDADGNLIVSADGGADTAYNSINSGFDVLLTFTPDSSGTYYVNARGYDEVPENGTTGDSVGDYELFVQTASPFAYKPYYDVDNPLYALDWGTQVDGTSRNPDGAEGPRPTGNAPTGHAWNPYGIEGKNVITYYFAKQGEIFIDENPATPGTTETMIAKGFEDWEKDVYLDAFGAYSKVADLVYVEVDSREEADFVLITYLGTPGPGASLLGRMSPPDEENEGRTEFNANDERWTQEGLAPGGFSFNTLIHELGHGHGMAHPHDNGGRSGILSGVESDGVAFSYTNGDFDLNQGIYTMMSYEDGWEKSPYGQADTGDGFGWLGSLMAFDVAVIQDKYGVNEEWATGDDVYRLKDENAPGTFYSCIWDAGGVDAIVYEGARDTTIDLRPATLKYEEGGGGWVSYAYGIHGGFTIANGVTIENATSGAGNDTLTGNDGDNRLSAGDGEDRIEGGAGSDTLVGGNGRDILEGGVGNDLYLFESTSDSVVGSGRDMILGFEQGSDRIDLVGAGGRFFVGQSAFSGEAGQVRFAAFAGATIIEVDADGDAAADFQVELDRDMALSIDDFAGLSDGTDPLRGDDVLTGSSGADRIEGRDGNDVLSGMAGNDLLIGGPGADRLSGGSGRDLFVYTDPGDSAVDASDIIADFVRRWDRIDLSAIDADPSTSANDAFRFVGQSAFSGAAGELRAFVDGDRTAIQGDVDGNLLADFQILLDGRVNLGASDFFL